MSIVSARLAKAALAMTVTGLSSVATVAPAQEMMVPESSYTVMLNQDSFFGFYPSFNGLMALSENMDFSFYGIFWTTPDFASNAPGGADLWTEFGAGVNLKYMDGKLNVKPQLGITNGVLQSGVNDGGGNFGDGIVPSLTINYSDDYFELESYNGYYIATADSDGNDFLHLWINGGYKFASFASGGLHYEWLDIPSADGDTVLYKWFGPYVQFSVDSGLFARFTAGSQIDAAGGEEGDFYKLNVGMSF